MTTHIKARDIVIGRINDDDVPIIIILIDIQVYPTMFTLVYN